jgi:ATP-dependent Lon protease|tara:strand:+ start:1657 stop:4062 length:2406 start_codon:yes stop_codon:yes gene_type:complete
MKKLIRIDQTHLVPDQLPVITLRDLVFFPNLVQPLIIGRPFSINALTNALNDEGYLLFLTQKNSETENPLATDLYSIGVISRVLETTWLPDGNAEVVFEGVERAKSESLDQSQTSLMAKIKPLPSKPLEGLNASESTTVHEVHELFEEYSSLKQGHSEQPLKPILSLNDTVRSALIIVHNLSLNLGEKQALLEEQNTLDSYKALKNILTSEVKSLKDFSKVTDGQHIKKHTTKGIVNQETAEKETQKEIFPINEEWMELASKIALASLPPKISERARRELDRFKKLGPMTPESAVIRNYLDWLLELPWTPKVLQSSTLEYAAQILNEGHFGLQDLKDRILDHIAVLSLVGELRGSIICLVGPPGVGKTSLGSSIATALDRDFVRISLGGIRDEAEIRGHRRTYVGSLPGRILQGMKNSGSTNPLFLLDEIDKLSNDFHGDPGSALLEVLDPEQNRTFTDHYMELEYDLSDVFFVATANTLSGIPGPLRDRMEVLRIPGYLDTEKVEIAQRFLWPKQARLHGLPNDFDLTLEAIQKVITDYTREAGVRELNRSISKVARKVARKLVTEGTKQQEKAILPKDLNVLLGPPTHFRQVLDEGDRVGMANGLAWTESGGEVIDVEVALVPGTGQVQLTGTLGDIMKESAFAAVTYARSRAEQLRLDPQFYKSLDIHIHLPEGATPKDGPSAGITIASALISALSATPSYKDVAMTGEITLRGRVLAIGGLKEKAVAAMREGVTKVIFPAANLSELSLLPPEVLEAEINFIPVRTMDEVIREALIPLKTTHLPIHENQPSENTHQAQ